MSESPSKHRIPLTSTIRLQLCAERDRTGKTPFALLRGRTDIPERLTASDVLSWLIEPYGGAIDVEEGHLNYILDCWAKEPDKQRMRHQSKRVKITDAYLNELLAQQERTGLKVSTFFRVIARDKKLTIPEGVKEHTVRSWQAGQIKQAYPEFLEFVLRAYKKQPDRKTKTYKKRPKPKEAKPPNPIQKYHDLRKAGLEPIPEIDWKKLDHYRMLGLLPGRVIRLSQDVPGGLDVFLIKHWLSKPTVKADPILLRWVLKRCRELQQFKV